MKLPKYKFVRFPNFCIFEIDSLCFHNIAYFLPCLGRMRMHKDGEAGRKTRLRTTRRLGDRITLYLDNFRFYNLNRQIQGLVPWRRHFFSLEILS